MRRLPFTTHQQQDPRLLVRRSDSHRWAINTAHRTSYLFVTAMVLALVMPALASWRAGELERLPLVLGASAVIVILLVFLMAQVGRAPQD